jgi:NAD(P)-dependent dehydrogenase (short-subunit alcohol dehydrogenase family)
VLVNNRRHAGEANAATSASLTVEAIRAAGGTAQASWCDVAEPGSGLQMVDQAMQHFGGVDIVVANAGIDHGRTFVKQSMDEFRHIFDTSFFGSLHLAHAAWPQLLGQGYGRLILTTSSAGLYGNVGQAAYSAAKAAVIGLMRALALEGRRHGVLVNAIAPYGLSQMTAPHLNASMAGALDPGRVAPLVGWLASPACDVSGEVLVAGAGLIRRAGVGETDALRMQAGQLASQLTDLSALPLHGYNCANDAFTTLMQTPTH